MELRNGGKSPQILKDGIAESRNGGKCSTFQNIGEKNVSLYWVIRLANSRLLLNLQLITSSTARGSGSSILSRPGWSLQTSAQSVQRTLGQATKLRYELLQFSHVSV